MAGQRMLSADNNYAELTGYFKAAGVKSVLLVCDSAFEYLNIKAYFDGLEKNMGIRVTMFSDFQPNPLYESVVEGVRLFRESGCEMIAAVGGGSAMDVAKCIKLYANMNPEVNYLKQEIVPNDIRLLAVPTTAGTGSEATRYAVIYYDGEKQSVSDYSCIPGAVLMDTSVLRTLPEYQKKSTMLDALCHAVESYWSVNSTEESRKYSREAIGIIAANREAYLANDDNGNACMLRAANIAGKAINITQTTAGHAMCYKLTSMYGIAHGHAAALCVAVLWPYMAANTDMCIDPRGTEHLNAVFNEMEEVMTADGFAKFVDSLELGIPAVGGDNDFELLKRSVNPVRLKNNPIGLDEEIIEDLYRKILGDSAEE